MKSLGSVFWNQHEGRLRALVRIVVFLAVWRLGALRLEALLSPPLAALYRLVIATPTPWLERALHFPIYLLATLLVVWLAARWVDRRGLADLGLGLTRRWWLELAAGLVLGLLLMSVVFVVLWLAGWVQVTALFAVNLPTLPFAVALLGPILAFAVIGIVEEVVFRGYILRNVAEGLRGGVGGARVAVIAAWLLTSALFGLWHIFNPSSSAISTANLIVAGVMLGLPGVLSQRLGFAIGLHMTWNFAQGTIFGFRVSGNEFGGVTLLRTVTSGPAWWTGGSFGPEAGLIALLVMTMGCLLILGWFRWRDRNLTLQTAWAIYTSASHIARRETQIMAGDGQRGSLPSHPASSKEHHS